MYHHKQFKLENLSKKTKLLLYNSGSTVRNGSISYPLEDWDYLTFGVGTDPNKDRMSFLVRVNFSVSGTRVRFQGIELEYNADNKTLKVLNNGGNLYYLEQHSSLT